MIRYMILLLSLFLNECDSIDVKFSYNPQSGMYLQLYDNIHAPTFDLNQFTQVSDQKIGRRLT